ncbi:MAG: metal-sensitive transcriptional regulator [Sphingomonadales bacterium]
MQTERRQNCLRRLRRIEGQVRGIARMIDEGRYCIDVLTQLQAARAALARVEDEMLKDHTAHCVAEAIDSGNPAEQQTKFDELVELLGKYKR